MGGKSELTEEQKTQIGDLRADGWSYARIAERLGIPSGRVERHVVSARPRGPVEPTWVRPPYPDASGKTSLEAANLHAAWLRDMLSTATAAGVPPKELAPIAGQYTQAMRFASRLDGSLDITEGQIVKSAPFQRLLGALSRAVGDDKTVWVRWEKELATLMGETR